MLVTMCMIQELFTLADLKSVIFRESFIFFLQASELSGDASAHPLDLFWGWVSVGFQQRDLSVGVKRRAPSMGVRG